MRATRAAPTYIGIDATPGNLRIGVDEPEARGFVQASSEATPLLKYSIVSILFFSVVAGCGRAVVPDTSVVSVTSIESGVDLGEAIAAGILRSPVATELDVMGRLWVLDNPSSETPPAAADPARVVVFDTTTGNELFAHSFAPDVLGATGKDLVYDDVHGYLYLVDAPAAAERAIVVYEVLRDTSYRVLAGHSAFGDSPLLLSLDGDSLVVLSAPDVTLFSIPTLAIRDRLVADVDRAAQIVVGAQP